MGATTTTAQEGPDMRATQPSIILNNGVELPAIGFGVFQTPPDVTRGPCRSSGSQPGSPPRRRPARRAPNQDEMDVRSFDRTIPEA
jgi:hypothetical protein